MLKALLAAFAMALTLFSAHAPAATPKAPPLPVYVDAVVEEWAETFHVEVRVKAITCGYDNAWYDPEARQIELCSDLFDRPELTRWVLHHELAHAVADHRGIPYEIDGETGADELAMVMATEDENLAAAQWFLYASIGKDHSPTDPHATDLDRAAAILCFLEGSDPEPSDRVCAIYARSVVANWVRLVVVTAGVSEE